MPLIRRKESFVCANCGESNPAIAKNERNHCRSCLYSLHVDDQIPGDRKAECRNFMEPIQALVDNKKEYIITHRCIACGHEKRNKIAMDDSREKISELITKANEYTLQKNHRNAGKKHRKNFLKLFQKERNGHYWRIRRS